MRQIKKIAAIAVIALAAFSCKNESKAEVVTVETETAVETTKAALDPNATYAKAEFTIEGMTCAIGCARTIEKKLAKMEGVKSAKVDYDKKLAMVEYDNAKVTTTSLEETVTKVGETYTVKEMKTVESFTGKKAEASTDKKTACAADCKKACCANKAEVSSSDKKMTCGADCKKACCADKAKS
ncbi:cation transporter [Lacinutrix sp. MEBiC02404]